MKEGYWINYRTGKVFEIQEHEMWLRTPGNARKLGVPGGVEKMFGRFRAVKDREKFLLFVMQNAPVMRVRGHGGYATFEYASHFKSEPLDAVWDWGRENAGPFTQLNIVNFATNESNSVSWQSFEEAMDAGGYDAVMRVAKSRVTRVRKALARELLAMAKELVSVSACLFLLVCMSMLGCLSTKEPRLSVMSVPEEIRGVAIRVLDGDTMDVVASNGVRRVRLADIDAPEKKQAFGQEARVELERMVAGKDVVVRYSEKDRYGRIIGEVRYGSNRWANAEMVALGMAWHYKAYSTNEALSRMERAARDLRMGLWSQDVFVAPWSYRKAD